MDSSLQMQKVVFQKGCLKFEVNYEDSWNLYIYKWDEGKEILFNSPPISFESYSDVIYFLETKDFNEYLFQSKYYLVVEDIYTGYFSKISHTYNSVSFKRNSIIYLNTPILQEGFYDNTIPLYTKARNCNELYSLDGNMFDLDSYSIEETFFFNIYTECPYFVYKGFAVEIAVDVETNTLYALSIYPVKEKESFQDIITAQANTIESFITEVKLSIDDYLDMP